ncbi:uncharacterized protein LOC143196581 [Rhynchophorus ferrugineus]|uniref:uncharacterized protein LOC143196581 n=1 Tax=Rhynchophorus ferrugineus TaxID=354439 RepID=UPI003FCE16E8
MDIVVAEKNILQFNLETGPNFDFLIQGQIYHLLGALLPLPDADHQFLQIYFMGNSDTEVDKRRAHNPIVKRTIVQELQMFLRQNNNLVNIFKIALDRMPSD